MTPMKHLIISLISCLPFLLFSQSRDFTARLTETGLEFNFGELDTFKFNESVELDAKIALITDIIDKEEFDQANAAIKTLLDMKLINGQLSINLVESPSSAAYFYLLGYLASKQQKYEDALASYSQAYALYETLPGGDYTGTLIGIHQSIARVYFNMGDYEKGYSEYTKLSSLLYYSNELHASIVWKVYAVGYDEYSGYYERGLNKLLKLEQEVIFLRKYSSNLRLDSLTIAENANFVQIYTGLSRLYAYQNDRKNSNKYFDKLLETLDIKFAYDGDPNNFISNQKAINDNIFDGNLNNQPLYWATEIPSPYYETSVDTLILNLIQTSEKFRKENELEITEKFLDLALKLSEEANLAVGKGMIGFLKSYVYELKGETDKAQEQYRLALSYKDLVETSNLYSVKQDFKNKEDRLEKDKQRLVRISNLQRNQKLLFLCLFLIAAIGTIIIFRNLKKIQSQKKAIELEKEQTQFIAKELRHRVKFNLLYISNQIDPLIDIVNDNEVKERIERIKDTTQSLTVIDQLLYLKRDNYEVISLSIYLESLIQHVCCNLYQCSKDKLHLDIDNISPEISTKKASLFGLIVTEFISNSIKHAGFSKINPLEFTFSLKQKKGLVFFHLKDHGRGIKENAMDFDNDNHLGLGIIRDTIMDSLNGRDFKLYNDRGTNLKFKFVPSSMKPPKQSEKDDQKN